jgi:hypothetical protein
LWLVGDVESLEQTLSSASHTLIMITLYAAMRDVINISFYNEDVTTFFTPTHTQKKVNEDGQLSLCTSALNYIQILYYF